LKGIIEFPKFLNVRSKDIIRKLLNPDVSKRLGVKDVRKKEKRNYLLYLGWGFNNGT